MASLHSVTLHAVLLLVVTSPFMVDSRPYTPSELQRRRLLLDIAGVNINVPPISDINVPPINNIIPNIPSLPPVNIPSLPPVNQILGNLGLPSLNNLNLNNLPDWNTLQQVLQSNIPINPSDISAPATLNFNLTNGCPANVNTSNVFNNAVRVIAARGVNVDPSNVEVTGVTCQGNQTQVNLAFLGNSSTTSVSQLQGYANQLQNNAGNIFGSVSQDVLNGLGILGVTGLSANSPAGSPGGGGTTGNGTNSNNTYTVPGGGSVVFPSPAAASKSGAGVVVVMLVATVSGLLAWMM